MNEGNKELRLALGMRGGVSLAIWIGGACTEIDRLRRADSDVDAFWRDLLEPSEYSSVIVDVIAGASAGGLNGVLYATSQHYGYDLDEVRDVWLEVGGLQSLLRGDEPWVSLLDADTGFLDVLQARLQRLIAGAAAPPKEPPRVDVQLSATLVEPITRPAPSPDDEPLTDVRYISRFHFAHEPRASWTSSDFPSLEETAALEAATWRFALAGRSTSSFPVAFEPAIVRSTRRERFDEVDEPDAAGRYVDMRGVFSDTRGPHRTGSTDADDFVIADGGILDNIPLGKALHAIADATADRPTKRYLVYLHPTGPSDADPSSGPTAPVPEAARRSLSPVVQGLLGSKVASESTLEDIAQMEAHNRAARRGAALRESAFAFASRPDPDDGAEAGVVVAGRAALSRYQQERSLGDARAVEALLDDPIGTLGGDPFPSKVCTTDPSGGGDDDGREVVDDKWRAPLADWSPAARQGLSGDLLREFGRRIEETVGSATEAGEAGRPTDCLPDAFIAGAGPLERVVRLMIGWARLLDQRGATTPGSDDPGALRQRLYDVLTFVRRNISAPRDLSWVICGALVEPGASWGTIPLDAVDRLHKVEPAAAEALCAELRGSAAESSARKQHAEDLAGLLDRIGVDAADPPDAVDLRVAIVDNLLVPIARELAAATLPDVDTAPGEVATPDPAEVLHAALSTPRSRQALDAGGSTARGVLAALEVLCYQEFLDGSPGSEICFIRMSAANPTPLSAAFEALREVGTDREVDTLTADRKLAGNEFKNFAAFVKDAWRANDWMWGRLDAAATLVELLVTPAFVQSLLGPQTDVDAALAKVEALVTANSLSEEWTAWLGENVWDGRTEDAVRQALEQFSNGDPGDDIPAAVAKIREVVLTRRQWEILADELAKSSAAGDAGSGGRLTPNVTAERVATHTVGLESMTRPRSFEYVSLFMKLSASGGKMVARNAQILSNPNSPDTAPRGLAKTAGRLTKWGGRAATIAFLVPRPVVWGAGVGAAAVVVAGVWLGVS